MDNMDNNKVTIAGQIVSEFTFSHTLYGENFYLVNISVQRLSNFADIIPVIISDRLIDINKNYLETCVIISGQFRSFNMHENEKNKLVLSVFAKEINIVSSPNEENFPVLQNDIYLSGYICKPPVYRKTPLGREICDILLAVNRPYGKSDYIPCICWGRNARYTNNLQVGEHIHIYGRIQSREYVKQNEIKIAYEVSIAKLETLVGKGAA